MNWLQLDLVHLLALTVAIGLACGLRVYALMLVLGIASHFGWLHLPGGMLLLAHPAVLTIVALLTLLEFMADKMPAIDTVWDSVHTFIRLPIGMALAASLASDGNRTLTVVLAMLGSFFAAVGHFAKTGTRAILNTSPEPFSNWAASLSEEVFSLTLIWLIICYPLAAGMLAMLMAVFCGWLISCLWRFMIRMFHQSALQPLPGVRRHATS